MGKKKTVKSDYEEELKLIHTERNNILNFKIEFKCKTQKQKELLKTLQNKTITFIKGPAGTGKSYVGIYSALTELKNNNIDKILFIYPTQEDEGESLGFLPGDEFEKVSPFFGPDKYTMEKMFTASGKNGPDIVNQLLNKKLIEIHPTLWMRGLTIDNSIVIISECQNMNSDILLKLITRIGENTKIYINGDIGQISSKGIKKGNKISGLQYAIDHLSILDEIGIVEFGTEDIVRNSLISKILKCWSPDVYGTLETIDKNKE